jgi:AAA+ superfamily predicted ATPase
MGEDLSPRWQRFLDGLAGATERRVQACGERMLDEVTRLVGARQAVEQAWLTATGLFAALDGALGELHRSAGLSAFEVDVVAVALGADLDPSFAVALDLLRSQGGSVGVPSVGAVLEVLGVANVVPAVRAALRPGSTLSVTGLLRVRGEGPFLARELVLSDRVAAHLLGDQEPAAALRPGLLAPWPMELPGAETVSEAWRAGANLVWVHGPAGSAGLAMAAGARAGSPVVAVDVSRVEEGLDAAILEAVLAGAALLVTGLSAEDAPSAVHRLAACRLPVAVIAETAWDPTWASWLPPVVSAPRLSPEARGDLWAAQGVSDLVPPAVGWPDLVALKVTPEEIRQVAALARIEGDTSTGGLLQTARRLGHQAGTMQRVDVTLDDLVLPPDTRAGLEEMIRWGRHRDTVLAQGPLMGKGRGRGVAALFAGGSGTGKTMAAQAVAGSLGLDLYQVDLASVVDKYIGEAEKRLAQIFATAERLNCVLFFDEADSLFGSRSAVQDARDRYANLEVSYLLQRLEQFDGLVVLATNLRGNLDSAFTRRLHFVLHFPEPDEAGRAALWQSHVRHLAALDAGDPVDIAALAAVEELSGGIIRNAVLSAAFAAHDDGDGKVGHRHLMAAVHRELRKMGRRATSVIPARRDAQVGRQVAGVSPPG